MRESENLQDTPESKLVKDNILIMDLTSIPTNHGIDLEKWAHFIKEQGVLFYDSSNGGDAPSFQKEDTTIKMYDVSVERDMKILEKILEEEVPEQENLFDPITEELTGQQIIDSVEHPGNDFTITTTSSTEGTLWIDAETGVTSARYVAGIDPINETESEEAINNRNDMLAEFQAQRTDLRETAPNYEAEVRALAEQYEVTPQEMAAMSTVPVGNGDFMLEEGNVTVTEGSPNGEIILSEDWINDNFTLTDDE